MFDETDTLVGETRHASACGRWGSPEHWRTANRVRVEGPPDVDTTATAPAAPKGWRALFLVAAGYLTRTRVPSGFPALDACPTSQGPSRGSLGDSRRPRHSKGPPFLANLMALLFRLTFLFIFFLVDRALISIPSVVIDQIPSL